MKKIFLILLLIIGIANGSSFTVDDPPMFYIYNFVTYDKISLVNPNVKKYDLLEIPLLKGKALNTTNNLLLEEELNPKLLSAMVTTAISEFPQIKIAGESIQSRIQQDNIMNILDSYDYPEETDYIFIGEINTLAQQFEIDLKIIDVSQQVINNSKSFQIPFDEIGNLRTETTKYVKSIMNDFLAPFTGIVCLHTDSIGIREIQPEMIVIRSVLSKVGSKKSLNTDKNFKRFQIKNLNTKHEEYFAEYLNKFPDDSFKIITSDNRNHFQFLEGKYIAKIYLKNNKDFYEVPFTVKTGMLNEIEYLPERKIIPKKILPKNGILNINGVQKNTIVEVFKRIDSSELTETLQIYNGESIFYGDSSILVDLNPDNKKCKISNLPFGSYDVFAFNLSREIFPGKASVDYLQFNNTFEINENNHEETINIQSGSLKTNRSIIIYFDPFPESPDELYWLYLSDFNIPITASQKAGELHIHNFPDSFNENIYVLREGYKMDMLPVNKNLKKQYLYANLSVKEEGKDFLKDKKDRATEFYQEIDISELSTSRLGPHHIEDEFVKTDEHSVLDTEFETEDTWDELEKQPAVIEKDDSQEHEVESIKVQQDDIITKSVSKKHSSFSFQSITPFLSVGASHPSLMGTLLGSYVHNPIQTGFNIKIGVRESLNKFFKLPDYLPLAAQVGLGFQMNNSVYSSGEDLMAITLNIDALYKLRVTDTPFSANPLLGFKFDTSIYETFTAYLLGAQLGVLVDFDLSDTVTKGLKAELLIAQSFDFDVSGKASPFLAMVYFNLGVNYTFNF